MLITLTGENDFGRTTELDRLIDGFVTEHGDLGLERVDGGETEFTKISEVLTSLPFLASKKLVVFKNPSENKEFSEKFEPLLNNLPETTDLILVEAKLDKRISLYKYLKKTSEYREFNQLHAGALASWLVKAAAERGGSITPSDARFLVERAGQNQQKLANELAKLLAFSAKISRNTINSLVAQTPQSKIFDLLDAAFAGNAKMALALYDEQRQLKVEPQQIIAMLAWQLHILALVCAAKGKSSRQIASDAKLHPRVVENSTRLAKRLDLAQLKRNISNLLEIDQKIKSSQIDADEALKLYLLEL